MRTVDIIGNIILFEGTEMVMSGDNVIVVFEFIYLVVMEFGLCFVFCEGGCIVGVGVVVKVLD